MYAFCVICMCVVLAFLSIYILYAVDLVEATRYHCVLAVGPVEGTILTLASTFHAAVPFFFFLPFQSSMASFSSSFL